MAETYRSAGVDVAACDAWLAALKSKLPSIGGFGGVFPLGKHITDMREPCLVASADGVGTKVMVARAVGDLATVGIDCVAMVVNDLVCCGARPLLFLDYLALGKFDKADADAIVWSLMRGCDQAGCVLLGGETAELPGLLSESDFDVCGFGVGVVERDRVIDGSSITLGDAVIGLASTGIHANGLSLARRALPEFAEDEALARELLTPTRIYTREVLALLEEVRAKGIAHITGGGLPSNLARVLPKGVDARLDPTRWERHTIFDRIAKNGGVETGETFRTFNMGIGMCVVVDPQDVDSSLVCLKSVEPRVIGEIAEGSGQVHIKGVEL